MLQKVFSSVRKLVIGEYYRSPENYWNARHARYATSLRAVGRVNLDEATNAENFEEKWRNVQDALVRTGPTQGRSLLDAGCGVGLFTAKFAALGFEISAVDFAPNAVNRARVNLGEFAQRIAWHVSALDEFAPGRTYDVVICIDVLFHIVDDQLFAKAVTNLAALTSSGGLLIIQDHLVPNADVTRDQPLGSSHVRWRSLQRYLEVLGQDWALRRHVHYELPGERGTKDLLVLYRSEASCASELLANSIK